MSLQPCPSCARHLRVSESRCPFCEAPVSLVRSAVVPLPGRLSRAAMFTFGTTIAVAALGGCGTTAAAPSTQNTTAHPDPIPPTTVEPEPNVPMYGAPSDPDPGIAVPAYGAAPEPIAIPPSS